MIFLSPTLFFFLLFMVKFKNKYEIFLPEKKNSIKFYSFNKDSRTTQYTDENFSGKKNH